ncbi:MAG: 2-succinyl-5-enolpyruvyl-6-hydroxy-3-cyclohexene-1-carboxylate synthase [Bacteroides heparinolyticus]|nr:2-succinyl-5-enolpyruvyl-6-hydroxy-3-cyclohexene-1-carboxylate synthase [Bacteroides heparinolyticus]
MSQLHYTAERSVQMLISILKHHNIKKVVTSPGATNVTVVGSLQGDSFFELYSSVDERSAAYIACGLAAESGEPVVLSCTGATASRNYMPALTEAYYRKLPILAVTSTQDENRIGHMVAQVIDRSSLPNDIAVLSEHVPVCHTSDDEWSANIKLNRAVLALTYRGGGPVHINLATEYNRDYSVKELPPCRIIERSIYGRNMPELPEGKIAIWVGTHPHWSEKLTAAVDEFCEKHGAVVFCDPTSNYHGRYRADVAIIMSQKRYGGGALRESITLGIHIGEVTSDYQSTKIISSAKQVWRVSLDGELRDPYKKLTHVFEMSETDFFAYYAELPSTCSKPNEFLDICNAEYENAVAKLPELPFSNIWIAQQTTKILPEDIVLHLGILNSIRVWSRFKISNTIDGYTNAGGFGIDGLLSTCIGGALACPQKLHLLVIGDLAFFYDMNALGNRHLPNNLRILLINNGKGIEFRNYSHPGAQFGDMADYFIAAAGHYGNKSSKLVKHYAQDLGLEYMSATSKEEYLKVVPNFLNMATNEHPMLFEVFTNSEDESNALEISENFLVDFMGAVKSFMKTAIPAPIVNSLRKMMK